LDPMALLNMASNLHVMTCDPGTCGVYSSTGFVILGLILTHHSKRSHWSELDLYDFFPEWVRAKYGRKIIFFNPGPCNAVPNIAHGYTRPVSEYIDVWDWSCMYGWMCGSLIADAQSVADFAYDLYGPRHALVSRSSLAQMLDFQMLEPPIMLGYGLGTMLVQPTMNEVENIMWAGNLSGHYDASNSLQPPGLIVGHMGEVFGFFAWTAYFAQGDFTLSVTTNINQFVPSDMSETPGLPGFGDVFGVVWPIVAQIQTILAARNITVNTVPSSSGYGDSLQAN